MVDVYESAKDTLQFRKQFLATCQVLDNVQPSIDCVGVLKQDNYTIYTINHNDSVSYTKVIKALDVPSNFRRSDSTDFGEFGANFGVA